MANPDSYYKTPRRDDESLRLTKWLIPCCQEKPRSEMDVEPYRKPTQVGRERILRRMRELWLRNSAK